jgi:hypothetical protein
MININHLLINHKIKKLIKYLTYFATLYLIQKIIIKGACSDKIILTTSVATCVFVILDSLCPLVNICKCVGTENDTN